MARRSVHRTGTGFSGHVISQDHGYLAVIKRMLQQLVFQHCALAATQYFGIFQTNATDYGIFQFIRQHDRNGLPLPVSFDQYVVKISMQGHSFVSR